MYRCNFKNRTVFFAFVFNHSSDHAGEQCSPLRGNIGYDQARHKRNGQARSIQGAGKVFAPNQNNNCIQRPLSQLRCQLPLRRGAKGGAVVFRFRRQFRYRASAITVWVQPQCATKKCLPLEGKVSPKVTDEVFSNPFAAGKHNLLSALKPFCEAKPNKRA